MNNSITKISTSSFEERVDNLIYLLHSDSSYELAFSGKITEEELGRIESEVLRRTLLCYNNIYDKTTEEVLHPQINLKFAKGAYNLWIEDYSSDAEIISIGIISEEVLREYLEALHEKLYDRSGNKVPEFTGVLSVKPCKM